MLVGYGQVNQHDENSETRARRPDGRRRPRGRRPAGAGSRRLRAHRQPAVLAVPRSWSAAGPTHPRHERRATRYTGVGGNVPQSLVNQACLDIQAGTRRRRADRGRRDLAHPNPRAGPRRASSSGPSRTTRCRWHPGPTTVSRWPGPAELRIQLDRPAYVYPMFEQAVRIAAGESPARPPRRIGELWSQFSAVAATESTRVEPESVRPPRRSAQPGPNNRMISWPYTKLMNSNNMVDQGAALILTSAEKADLPPDPHGALGFPVRRHRRTRHVRDRRTSGVPSVAGDPDRRPARAGTGRDGRRRHRADRRLLMLPVGGAGGRRRTRAAARRPARPLTVTGGLTFAGGPWNNYVTHSIATMAERLVADPGARRPHHGQRRLPHQAQLRRLRYRATAPRIPLGRRAIRRRPRTDPRPPSSSGRRRHRRVVDHAVQPRRSAGEGLPRRAHTRRLPHARGAHRPVRGRGQRP